MRTRFLNTVIHGGIMILVIYGCQNGNKENKLPGTAANKPDNIICMDYANNPVNKISVALVKDMIEGYQENQLEHIKWGMNTDFPKGVFYDAHSIWFDIETLKKFIYHIEVITRNDSEINNNKRLGIRVYYAKYPPKDKWKEGKYQNDLMNFVGTELKKQYENHHTLILVPTIEREGYNEDLIITKDPSANTPHIGFPSGNTPGSGQIGAGSSSDSISNLNKKMFALFYSKLSNKKSESGIVSQNHGSLIPPGDDTGEAFKID